jgi:predicted TIM-barrel fold metal-dependent hydrolase
MVCKNSLWKRRNLKGVSALIIDIHAHIWTNNYETNKRELIRACELYHITKIYVSALNSQYPDEAEINELNSETARFMKEQPHHIGGFCYVNPCNRNALDVLKKGIEEQGMAGMKLWIATYCDDPRVFPLIEKCIDYNIPILIHSFHKAIGQLDHESVGCHVAGLAMRYPKAKLLMAHLGGNAYNGIKAIQSCPNVWVDISGSLFRRDEVDYTKKMIGANRILFGTDMPGASFFANLGQIEDADLTPEEKELIYYKNALKILNREERIL